MRRFKPVGHAQRFLSVHGPVQNLFRVGRPARRSYSPSRPLRYSSRTSWATRVSRRLALAISGWAFRHACWARGLMSSFSRRGALARTSSAVPRASG